MYVAYRDAVQHPLHKGRCVAGVKAVAAVAVTAAVVPLVEVSHLIPGHCSLVQVQCSTIQDTLCSRDKVPKATPGQEIISGMQDATKAFVAS